MSETTPRSKGLARQPRGPYQRRGHVTLEAEDRTMAAEERREKARVLKRLEKAVQLRDEARERLESRRGCSDEKELIRRWSVLCNRVRRISFTLSGYY